MLQNIDYAVLGKRIKETRQVSGITQEALAEMVSCNTSHISNIENNYTKPSLNVLLSIANALNTSIDFLLSNQYSNESLALNNEIFLLFSLLPEEKKQQLIRIIKVL